MNIAFYCFAALTVLSALVVLWTRQLLYSAFALLFTLLGMSGLYVLAGADYVAIVQIMIYVGGVLVLLIFGIMLTNRPGTGHAPTSGRINQFTGILAAGGLFVLFFTVFLKANLPFPALKSSPHSSVTPIGIGLMTDYLLPFEIAGILLMVALMGAAYIAGRKRL
ncbi:NADH-quinone oxidoreductase subunit J [Cytophagaceae bacterium DM2B3-1]|uniref:NADH-quinone oxidoreductase subunit J n=1 Tax=Xanthocytophaga flava TaxID=3048013 RepID=A0ABT7CDI1_9BACT|nr:NADH-quinone oxidoreductase subunit J [Xanthocytophaga flavus]MDJ1491740.1 NADH-quinone oxidoreductase subunit J [Xanthocytophaga flavus]